MLNLAVASLLYARLSCQTGEISRASGPNLVKRETLHQLASGLELSRSFGWARGVARSGGHARPSILADALEALIRSRLPGYGFDAAQAWSIACSARSISIPA